MSRQRVLQLPVPDGVLGSVPAKCSLPVLGFPLGHRERIRAAELGVSFWGGFSGSFHIGPLKNKLLPGDLRTALGQESRPSFKNIGHGWSQGGFSMVNAIVLSQGLKSCSHHTN